MKVLSDLYSEWENWDDTQGRDILSPWFPTNCPVCGNEFTDSSLEKCNREFLKGETHFILECKTCKKNVLEVNVSFKPYYDIKDI